MQMDFWKRVVADRLRPPWKRPQPSPEVQAEIFQLKMEFADATLSDDEKLVRLQRVVQLDPSDPVTHEMLARLHYRLGNVSKCHEHLALASAFGPWTFMAYQWMAFLQELEGNSAVARALLGRGAWELRSVYQDFEPQSKVDEHLRTFYEGFDRMVTQARARADTGTDESSQTEE